MMTSNEHSTCESEGGDFTAISGRMPRLYLKRVVIVAGAVLLTCLLVVVWEYHRRTRPYYRGVPDVDPKLWKLLLHDETTQRPTPRPADRVHVKQLPPLSINIGWSLERVEETFFSYLENKDVRCDKDVRVGNWHDGGWNVCLSPPFNLRQPCVVFSFGIGYDWQFDDSVSGNYGCQVLAFDPSMKEQEVPHNTMIQFRRIGLAAKNGIGKNGWKMKTLRQHFQDEGFLEVPIDYLKIDIEYMEWESLRQALTDGSLKLVKQLGFEMHTPEMFHSLKTANETLVRDPRQEKLDFVHMFETLRQIEIMGFRKFNFRKNPFGQYTSVYTKKEHSCCYELHYINTDFLQDNNTLIHYSDSKLFHR